MQLPQMSMKKGLEVFGENGVAVIRMKNSTVKCLYNSFKLKSSLNLKGCLNLENNCKNCSSLSSNKLVLISSVVDKGESL